MKVNVVPARKQRVLVVIAALALAAVGIGYTVYAVGRSAGSSAQAVGDAVPATTPGLYVRSSDGTVVVQEPDAAADEAEGTGLPCFRFYAAGDTAVCLTAHGGLQPTTKAAILDAHLKEKQTIEFAGTPNRARVSPSGRMVSWTVFVTGDNYATTDFSTRTGILDTKTGYLIKSIETIQLYIDDKRYGAPDVNFWGVTFADDDNKFYATVSTQGQTYLVEGDMETWTARNLRTNVECPSLSPDGERLVFKKRVREGLEDPWQLHVLDLDTMKETPLAETRSIDDQAAWIDENTVAYAVGDDVWEVPADGTGKPKLRASGASSPSMVAP